MPIVIQPEYGLAELCRCGFTDPAAIRNLLTVLWLHGALTLAIACLPIASLAAALLTGWTMSAAWLGSLPALWARAQRLLARRTTASK